MQVRKTSAAVLKIVSKWIEVEQQKGSQSQYIAELRSTFDAIISDGGVPVRRRDGSRRGDGITDTRDTGGQPSFPPTLAEV